MVRGLKTGFAVLAICGAFAGAVQAQGALVKNAPAGDSSVFALFDRGVMSIVAANACKSADKATLQAFTQDFGEVASLVEVELQGMNPGQRRDDLAMLIGFRVAQLELRAEEAIRTGGCEAEHVKAMRQLFDLKSQLAMVRLEDHNLTH